MESISLETILQLVGPGPVVAILFLLWKLKPTYDRHVKALQRDNTLRKIQIRQTEALMNFLKENGHEIQAPDITKEL